MRRGIGTLGSSLGIDHDHGVWKRVDRRLGRLLRSQQADCSRLAVLANCPGHRVERLAELSELVLRGRGHNLVEVALRDRSRPFRHGNDRLQDQPCQDPRRDDGQDDGNQQRRDHQAGRAGCVPKRFLVHLFHVPLVQKKHLVFQLPEVLELGKQSSKVDVGPVGCRGVVKVEIVGCKIEGTPVFGRQLVHELSFAGNRHVVLLDAELAIELLLGLVELFTCLLCPPAEGEHQP